MSRVEDLQTLGQSLAASSAALLEDVREGFFPRPAVADEEAVDNSVAGAGDAASFVGHGVLGPPVLEPPYASALSHIE
jgi:hypothetical protein